MKKVTLNIENFSGSSSVTVDDELSIGRTDQARLVVDDEGLSRVNTTIFRDGDEVLIVDENSTNGTFVNGRQITGAPTPLQDGDEITIGNNTRIYVRIGDEREAAPPSIQTGGTSSSGTPNETPKKPKTPKTKKAAASTPPAMNPMTMMILGSVAFVFVVVVVVVVAVVLSSQPTTVSNKKDPSRTPQLPHSDLIIPIRVIDPLGGESPSDTVDDVLALWEVEDKSADVADLQEVQSTKSSGDVSAEELKVTPEFWKSQQDLAMRPIPGLGPSGISPPGLQPPKELAGDGVIKQKMKLAEMKTAGYQQPLDFAELAKKRLDGELIELPLATKTFLLEVGSNATDGEFTEFVWDGNSPKSVPLQPGSPKYQILKRLADDFSGQKYDLNVPADRKQMKIRLLRMFNYHAKPILYKIAAAYEDKFHKPLRVTSLTRSMEYQISLNSTNANSFKVRDAASLPPHTSGCAFDLARKHMSVDEQNFLMQFLAQMERNNEIDALIEYNANACFHNFIYFDGKPPSFAKK